MKDKIRTLIIGSGGREYALARAIAASPNCAELFIHPHNDAITRYAKPLPSNNDIIQQAQKNNISLVAIGPEQPLVDGLADKFREANIPVFGPGAAAARIEGSKITMKQLADKANIPTARWRAAATPAEAHSILNKHGAPVVIKTDGLAAGKGVTVARDRKTAEDAIHSAMTEKRFGGAGERIILEETLDGEELSCFALLDGNGGVMPFPSARDWKRAGPRPDSDNTGGMASLSPAPGITRDEENEILARFIRPVDETLRREGSPFRGVLFAGLMRTREGLRLLEYNIRFGDPETQAILPRLESDLLELLRLCAAGSLNEAPPPRFSADLCFHLVLAARGYPREYQTDTVIKGLAALEKEREHTDGDGEEVRIVHAATRRDGGEWRAAGGRVLGLSARAPDLATARTRIRGALARLDWQEGFHREDLLRD